MKARGKVSIQVGDEMNESFGKYYVVGTPELIIGMLGVVNWTDSDTVTAILVKQNMKLSPLLNFLLAGCLSGYVSWLMK